jgi:hypothetical protein
VTIRPAQDHYINRTFECEFFILDQANNAYNDPTTIEYDQASLIIRNAVGFFQAKRFSSRTLNLNRNPN